MVEAAFLELGRPSLEEAADLLVARGVRQIVVIPYFLTPGTHLERDLPSWCGIYPINTKTYRSPSHPPWMATRDWSASSLIGPVSAIG